MVLGWQRPPRSFTQWEINMEQGTRCAFCGKVLDAQTAEHGTSGEIEGVIWVCDFRCFLRFLAKRRYSACNLCGVATTRPHSHPEYEMSVWFPPN